jgi:hypothetical protein
MINLNASCDAAAQPNTIKPERVMGEERKVGLRQVISSVAAAFIGVQSGRNRERDFSHGRPRDYILMGVVFTLLFVLLIWGVVSLVMKLAT